VRLTATVFERADDVTRIGGGILRSVASVVTGGYSAHSVSGRSRVRAKACVHLNDGTISLSDELFSARADTGRSVGRDAGEQVELVKLLPERGADPIEADAERWATPRAWAEKMNHDHVLAELRKRDPHRI
jgi:hypothetical protein